MADFLLRLRQRKLVQWAIAYVAFAFALLQGLALFAQQFDWSAQWMRGISLACVVGFFVALVVAWYHGERGAQRVTGAELLLIALVLAAGGGVMWRFVRGTPPAAAKGAARIADAPVGASAVPVSAKSVAVLPLLNESNDVGQDYFSDGLSEELISALGQVRDLKVIGRNSSFRFRGQAQDDTAGIAAKLGVATLLEGTVRKQGDEVRIVASLIKASDGSQLWSQTYERQLKDVFAVQSDIATSVASALKAKVFGSTVVAIDKPPSGNMVAYDAMLQGRYYADRRTRADYFKAVDYYQQAIKLDPDYALAYARLAIAQQWFNDWSAGADERKVVGAQARANARKAVELAPQSAIAWGALGINQAWTDFDYPAAETTLKKAVALDPSDAEALYQLADVTACLGQLDQAIGTMHRVLVMEPLNASFHFYIGQFLLAVGRDAQAETEIKRALELQPAMEAAHALLAVAYIQQHRFSEAMAEAEAEPQPQSRRWALASSYFAEGNVSQGQRLLDEMIRRDSSFGPTYIAMVYAMRGDADNAFAWLDRAVAARDPGVASLYEQPWLVAGLRTDPRMAALCRKLGIPVPAEVGTNATAAPASLP